MIILAHRGYWQKEQEKNKLISFQRAKAMSFGVETDVRDYCGKLVISHDIADESSLSADELFKIYDGTGHTLAINIKADGLWNLLRPLLADYQNYFCFDMSIPDTLGYIQAGMNFFTRQSEYEETPAFYDKAMGVWMDCFLSDWIDGKSIREHLSAGKRVCIVSPELHKRNHLPAWSKYAEFASCDDVLLCTDYPDKAREFFCE